MTNHRIVEAVFKRLLKEGINDPPNAKGLACAYSEGETSSWAYVYRIEETPITNGNYTKRSVAFVEIVKPKDECADAWEVTYSAGDGKLAYGMGYALSPAGILMPDRSIVSRKARDAWRNQFNSGRETVNLDDKENPKTPPVWDDCKVYRSDPEKFILNKAYAASGWERGVFEEMTSRWDEEYLTVGKAEWFGRMFFHDKFQEGGMARISQLRADYRR